VSDSRNLAGIERAIAQQAAKRSKYEQNLQAQLNAPTIGLAAGRLEGAPIRFASELARIVDDGRKMRVLPIVTHGPAAYEVKMPDGSILNRHWDDVNAPRQESYAEDVATGKTYVNKDGKAYVNLRASAESGWDFSSRWFADDKNITSIEVIDILPVDLNSLLFNLEQAIAIAYQLRKDKKNFDKYQTKSVQRGIAIEKYFWNSKLSFYTDYNFKKKKLLDKITPAGMYPLCFDFIHPNLLKKKGQLIAATVKNKLVKEGGIVTTENNTGEQWDAPNGWAPLEWMTIWGLERCGQSELARDIAQHWVKLNADVFERTGRLMEKYNVADTHLEAGGGEYPGQDGFGWTNGVLLTLINKYHLHPKD